MKHWLQDIYEGFDPRWPFRVGGVLLGLFSVVMLFTTGWWPWNHPDSTMSIHALWLYPVWGVVELLGIWAEAED